MNDNIPPEIYMHDGQWTNDDFVCSCELHRLMRAISTAQNFYETDASLAQLDWLALKRLAQRITEYDKGYGEGLELSDIGHFVD